jgi:hypothetical protein
MTITPEGFTWGVWCTRRGGVMPPAGAWAKRNGRVIRTSEEEARALAKRWTDGLGKFGPATITYDARMMREPQS